MFDVLHKIAISKHTFGKFDFFTIFNISKRYHFGFLIFLKMLNIWQLASIGFRFSIQFWWEIAENLLHLKKQGSANFCYISTFIVWWLKSRTVLSVKWRLYKNAWRQGVCWSIPVLQWNFGRMSFTTQSWAWLLA